ncbi:MAG: CoA transferase [Candidatus Eremiobacteraeota bacterium]|nr:CoA transferase [Candidatus Eremiobacteraeota bacterium]
MQLLKGLKVIELASVLAGPAVGMFFAELGATVTKIENKKTGGDLTRTWRSLSEDDHPVTAYFSSVNCGKTYLSLDLSDARDYGRLLKLLARADIVLSNFRADSAKKLKVDYRTIKSINARIVYGQIRGFKDSSRPAFDVVLQAETGFMDMNGAPDAEACKMPVALIDVLAAHQLKEGILLALLKREKTGRGSYVECSLEEASIASLVNQASSYLMNGTIPRRMGSLHPSIAPYGEIVYTKDRRPLVLAIGSDRQFSELCRLVDIKETALDGRFIDNPGRVARRKELHEILSRAFSLKRFAQIYPALIQADVPVGAIRNLKEVLSAPAAQHMILEEDIEGKHTRRVKTVAFTIC